MRLLFFLLLISTGCFGQLVNNNVLLQSVARDTVEIPYPFLANSVDTDSIRTEWIDIGADTYVLESDDNFDFSSPTTEYSGTNLSYTLTGLGANVKRYFRLHAETDGLVNSPYAYDSATTFPFTPVAFYEGTGIAREDNRYFDYSGFSAQMDSVLSVINYSGPSLYTPGIKGVFNYNGLNLYSYIYYIHNTVHQPTNSGFVFGDFEINFWMYINGAVTNSACFANSSDAAQYIRFNSLSQIRFARTTGVTLTLDTPLESGKPYFITFQRSGTTFTVIVKDWKGNTETKSGTGPSTSVTFDRIFFSSSKFWMGRLSLMDRVLTSDERTAVENYTKRPVVPAETTTIQNVKGITLNSFTPPYLINTDFANTMVSSFTRDRFLGFGEYEFALTSKKFAAPDYGEDLLYVFKNDNQVSNPISLGVPSTTEDVHNSGGICIWGEYLVHFEQDKHYDDGTENTLVVKIFGKNFNLVGYKEIPLGKGVVTHTGIHLQYHQVNIINDKIYIVAQELAAQASVTSAGRTVLLVSDDGWNFFKKYHIASIDAGEEDFLYHNLLYSEDKLILTIDHLFDSENDFHRASYILVCDDFSDSDIIFRNVADTYSKDITLGTPLTIAELDANYLLGTAISGSPSSTTSVKQSHGLYDPDANEAYVIRFNGNDDGLILCEVDFTAETITEYAIPETIDGHTVDVSCVGSGATNQPFGYKDGSTYYAVVGEVNAGNTKIIRVSSADGSTWSYVDQLSADDTKPHIRIMPTKNWYYTQTRSVWASRDQTTYGDLFRYNISTP